LSLLFLGFLSLGCFGAFVFSVAFTVFLGSAFFAVGFLLPLAEDLS